MFEANLGVLALGTLAIVVLIVGFVYLRSLREGRNMDAAKNITEGGSSAHTAVRGGSTPEHLKDAKETR